MVRKQSGNIDALLEPLLLPTRNNEIDQLLSELIATHAEPVIKGIIRKKLHLNSHRGIDRADADDIHQEVVMQLLVALQRFREQPAIHPVEDLRGLTAVIAHRACSRWMRRKFPERHALKNRLLYLFTRHEELALWKRENGRLTAGFAIWRGQDAIAAEDHFDRVFGNEAIAGRIRLLTCSKQTGWAGALTEIFDCLRAPVDFDRLVGILTESLHVEDRSIESIDRLEQLEDFDQLNIFSPHTDAARRTECRIFLQRLWEEVCQLPKNQRVALLLNLRDQDGRGCLALFPALGISTFRQMAATLEMSAESLAELCNGLPLEDIKIAELLQMTQRQVINARKSARQRLTRRLKEFI